MERGIGICLISFARKRHPDDTWLSILMKLRNIATHRNVLNYRYEVSLFENISTGNITTAKGSSGPVRVYFKEDPDSTLEIIPYLEDRIQKMKRLIDEIMKRSNSFNSLNPSQVTYKLQLREIKILDKLV